MSTATVQTRRPVQLDVRRDVSFVRVINSEWIKFRTLRSTWYVLAGAMVAMIGIALLIGANLGPKWNTLSAQNSAPSVVLQGYFLAQLLIGVLGVLFVSAEYTTGMIRSTLAAVPGRISVVAAKGLVFGGVALATMVTASVIGFLGAQAFLSQYNHGVSLGSAGVLRVVLGTGAYLALVGLLGAAIGWILRSTAGGIAALFGLLLVVPVILNALPGSARQDHCGVPPGWRWQLVHQQRPDVEHAQPGRGFRCPAGMGARWAAPGDVHAQAARRLIETVAQRAASEDDGAMSPVAELAARIRRSLPSQGAQSRLVEGLVLGTVLVVGVVPDLAGPQGMRSATVLAFDLALILPLVGRRRAPFAVFLIQVAVALAQWGADLQVSADFAVLISLYAVGAHGSRRIHVVYAGVIAHLGAVLFAVAWGPKSHLVGSTVLLTGTVAASWVLGVYVRTRRAYLTSVLERARSAEQERDARALMAATEERARISREMHDIVAHSLSVMIALSDGAAAAIARAPLEAQQAMEQSSALGRQSLWEIRSVLGDLRGAEELERAPQPGIDALEDLVRQVRAAGLPVELVVVGQPRVLVPSAELAVYRLDPGEPHQCAQARAPGQPGHRDPALPGQRCAARDRQRRPSRYGGPGRRQAHRPRHCRHARAGSGFQR